jgi:lysophospholipase L1-like esterase
MKTLRIVVLLLALLTAWRPGSADTPRVPVYPTLAAHPDLVPVAPYAPIEVGEANWGVGATGGEPRAREFLTRGNQNRIRQSGTIRRIRVNLQESAGLTGFYLRVWRQIGRTFDLVGSSENLGPRMTTGMNTLELQRPVVAQEGDYYGYRIESTAPANFFALRKREGAISHSASGDAMRATEFDWRAQTPVVGAVLPIELYMQAPILVAIGDGMVVGNLDHATFVETNQAIRPGEDLLSLLGEQWRVSRQNMAVKGSTIDEVSARFTSDVVNLKPRIALIGAGSTDILRGPAIPLTTYLARWRSMLDACQANGIKPLVILSHPSATRYTAAQSRLRDEWNGALRELVKGYPHAVVIDISPYVGEPRPSGPAGNLWNTQRRYLSPDGVRFNDAGIRQVVRAIVDQYTEP